jgi:hypothetical protein
MKWWLVVVAVCVAVFCVSACAHASLNLVQNGGFELNGAGDVANGGVTDWNLSVGADGSPGWTDVTTLDNGLLPRSGSYFVEFGDSVPDTISQTIATIPGQVYHFGWWLGSENLYGYPTPSPIVNEPNEMTVTWGGNVVADITNFTSPTWVRYSFTEVATSDSTVISFSGYDDATFVGLDDVNVEAIPEPTALIIWTALGVAIGFGSWRKRKIA